MSEGAKGLMEKPSGGTLKEDKEGNVRCSMGEATREVCTSNREVGSIHGNKVNCFRNSFVRKTVLKVGQKGLWEIEGVKIEREPGEDKWFEDTGAPLRSKGSSVARIGVIGGAGTGGNRDNDKLRKRDAATEIKGEIILHKGMMGSKNE